MVMLREVSTRPGKVVISVDCPICNKSSSVAIEGDDAVGRLQRYLSPNRPVIQSIFPDMDLADREVLVTGICRFCWDRLTTEEEQ